MGRKIKTILKNAIATAKTYPYPSSSLSSYHAVGLTFKRKGLPGKPFLHQLIMYLQLHTHLAWHMHGRRLFFYG
jgi:hypothetical protein